MEYVFKLLTFLKLQIQANYHQEKIDNFGKLLKYFAS
jgi:hypothetical protein